MRSLQRQNPHFVVASGQKGFVDRRVNARIVACPDCHVGVGEDCVALPGASTPTGEPVRTCHKARRRMAIRALNHQEAAA